ncbi:hypothetical protein ROA7450_00249 [Roseovarius albus]|uniref:Porin domain-containing protein n=1 Tax=Roseovarius albus TaxID=1247867 RepID=A0A1X6Y8R3_9RHOB|nr:hypothetical protein [Roseovarius albus]SLN14098.1 hypothetical protein ROA7450_00249 [Roseovarius albus]
MTKFLLIAGGAALGLTATTANAFETGRLSGYLSIEIENDWTFDSSDPAAEISDTYTTIESGLSFDFGAGFALNSTLVFEPIRDAEDDRFFEDEGLYAEELFFSKELGTAELKLGKFNPEFGFAWDVAPGIFGADFAEDYEVTERIGGALSVPFSAAGGEHSFSVGVFNADRSILSNSLGARRGQTSLGSGGVSNTNGAESWTANLSGEFSSTVYTLGVQHQAAGEGDTTDQDGAVLGVIQTVETGSTALELLAEVVYFNHYDGGTESATYLNLGVSAPVGPVTLAGVYGLRDIEGASADNLFTVSAEMELFGGITGGLAYRYGDEEGVDSHTLGTLLAYEF